MSVYIINHYLVLISPFFYQGQENKTFINKEGDTVCQFLFFLDFLIQKTQTHLVLVLYILLVGYFTLTLHHLKEPFVFPSISHHSMATQRDDCQTRQSQNQLAPVWIRGEGESTKP